MRVPGIAIFIATVLALLSMLMYFEHVDKYIAISLIAAGFIAIGAIVWDASKTK